MPEGPPPGGEDSDSDASDDSDDIPLPSGPPPPKPAVLPQDAPPIYMGFGAPAPHQQQRQARPPPTQSSFRPPPSYQHQPHALPARPGIISAQAQPTNLTTTAPAAKPTPQTGGMISAEPQLRDLRKEATVFVPRGIKRKKGPGAAPTINATPNGGDVDDEGDAVRRKRDDGPDLKSRLQGVLGDAPALAPSQAKKPAQSAGGGGDDDYQNFLKGLGDIS